MDFILEHGEFWQMSSSKTRVIGEFVVGMGWFFDPSEWGTKGTSVAALMIGSDSESECIFDVCFYSKEWVSKWNSMFFYCFVVDHDDDDDDGDVQIQS